MRKGFAGLKKLVLIILAAALALGMLSGATGAAAEVPAPEAPLPARPAPREAAEDRFPDVIDRVTVPGTEENFRFRLDAELLEIWFPNIMNADEAILMYGGDVWLIDCGDVKMGTRGAELIRKLGIKSIGKLFNSHPHHDHLNGLAVTDQAAKVEELYICFPAASTEHMIRAVEYADANGIPVREYRSGSEFTMGDGAVSLKFYVNTDPTLDMNNQSAQTMITYGERNIFFMADMEQLGQVVLINHVVPRKDLKADLVKYPHHGKSPLFETMYDALGAKAAIVTNKRVEDWSGIKYLRGKGMPILYTNREGMYLHLVTDGEHWVCEYVDQAAVGGLSD